MLHIELRYEGEQASSATLTLPFDKRQKSRLRATLDDGRAVAITLERGTSLRDGDKLRTADGEIVQVRGADESLSVVRATDSLAMTKAAYHLGNRHVPLQIGPGELCYQHDHVLDAMLHQLGLDVSCEQRPFEPESGAYGQGHPHGGHSHSHGKGRIHHHHSHTPEHEHD
jgi:urease accessory protein